MESGLGSGDGAAPQRRGDTPNGEATPRTPPPAQDTQASRLPAPPQGDFNARIVSTTDPDAATTKRRGRGVTLGYRDHCLVDDRHGIITATIATAADYDDAALLEPLLDEHAARLGGDPARATGDCAFGTKQNIEALRRRGIRPYLKPRASKSARGGWLDRMPPECPRGAARHWLGRRLAVAEGRFAHAKTRHSHGRCRWRRRWRVQIQCYLVAMTQNILKLARYRSRRRPPNHAMMGLIPVPLAPETSPTTLQHLLAPLIRFPFIATIITPIPSRHPQPAF
jgi:IS5 family transposase